MAKWQTLTKQADKLQAEADYLYEQVEAAQCPQLLRLMDGSSYAPSRRCQRDADHTGHHHIEP